MKLFRTTGGPFVEEGGQHYLVADHTWDALLAREDLPKFLGEAVAQMKPSLDFHEAKLLAPISRQEVWAAGVTYYRSRGARMEESKDAGGGNFYDRVYSAERPELFFKSTANRTVGAGGKVRIRGDARWSVPEPELAAATWAGEASLGSATTVSVLAAAVIAISCWRSSISKAMV